MADQTLATEKWCNQGTAGARSAPSDRTNSLARSHCGEPPTAPDQLWPSGLARNGNFDLLQLAGSAPAAAAKKWPATATWLQRASMWLACSPCIVWPSVRRCLVGICPARASSHFFVRSHRLAATLIAQQLLRWSLVT